MSYVISEYENPRTGVKEVHKYYNANYGAPGQRREARSKPTYNAQKRQNAWNKQEKVRRYIQSNFGPYDYHYTMTFKKELRPESDEELKRIKKSFLEAMREAYRKEGWEFKWLMVIERGKRGAIHWHMIVNNCHNDHTDTAKLIAMYWKRGRPYGVPLDEDTDSYGNLAKYLLKDQEKEINDYRLRDVRYYRSKNLIVPEEKKRVVKEASSWRRIPRAPEGYYVAQVLNGRNRFTGLPYQRYILKPAPKPKGFEMEIIDPATWWNLEPDDEMYTDEKRKEETDAGGSIRRNQYEL